MIRLPSGNHGIVLDVSQEGLSFLACAPIEEEQPMRFRISGKSAPGAEATGELMWKDGTGKRAGLKFTQLPDELRTLIGGCLPRPRFFLPLQDDAKTRPREVLAREEVPAITAAPTSAKLTFFANAITVILACVIAVAIGYSMDRRGAADSLDHLRRGISTIVSVKAIRVPHWWGAPVASTQRAAPALSATVKNRVAEFPKPDAIAQTPSQQVTTGHSGPSVSPQPPPIRTAAQAPDRTTTPSEPPVFSPPSKPSEDPGQTQLALARELLQKGDDTGRQSKAAQLLWQAVEKGNPSAEIELSNLYLLGRGVPKSCGQARVLLAAAQSRKKEVAQQKLGDFPKYGCESDRNLGSLAGQQADPVRETP
jgi:hypothetical protein